MSTQPQNPVVVYITCPDQEVAQKLSRGLVEHRLVACCNIFPAVSSIYQWKNEIQTDSEIVIIAKSQSAHFDKIQKFVLENHPYECPCLTSWPITKGHPDYLKWIIDETK